MNYATGIFLSLAARALHLADRTSAIKTMNMRYSTASFSSSFWFCMEVYNLFNSFSSAIASSQRALIHGRSSETFPHQSSSTLI